MPELPSLGGEPKKSPVPGIVGGAIVVALIAGGALWLHGRKEQAPDANPAVAAAPAKDAGAADAPTTAVAAAQPGSADPSKTLGGPTPAMGIDGLEGTGAPPSAPAPAARPSADANGLKGFTATVNGPLESAVTGAVGKSVGTALTQVVNRSLVWWLRVPQDLVKGDTLSVVYEERDGQEPLVHAVRFTSKKLGKTLEAYRFKPQGETFAHFYQADGEELEKRLVDGPVDSWEQVTSLLRDGRGHRGVDFKTPVGTPVKATFTGVVERANWNFRSNGNCLQIAEKGGQGRTAVFLHLSEIEKNAAIGSTVKQGDVVARSGNTGHSFAPHLHYQLQKGEKVIDPFESHQTERKTIAGSQKPALEQAITRLRALMPPDHGA